MQDLQEVFLRLQTIQKEYRELKKAYNDALQATGEYEDIQDKLKSLRDRKKQIQTMVEAQLSDQIQKLEALAKDMSNDRQLISDIALTSLIKGESVKVLGFDDIPYEPQFSVKFKKKS